MKKNKRDEPIGVIIHMYLEILRRNSLCSYFYLKQAKISFFYLFLSTKLGNRKVGQVLVRGGGEG
jgi:hypothetical protein